MGESVGDKVSMEGGREKAVMETVKWHQEMRIMLWEGNVWSREGGGLGC